MNSNARAIPLGAQLSAHCQDCSWGTSGYTDKSRQTICQGARNHALMNPQHVAIVTETIKTAYEVPLHDPLKGGDSDASGGTSTGPRNE